MQKKIWKRLFSVITAIEIVIGFVLSVPCHVNAQTVQVQMENNSYEEIYYTINTVGNAVISGALETCSSTLEIPSSIEGRLVTEIEAEAFAGNTNIQKIVVPDSVTRIGDRAFADCSNLQMLEGAAGIVSVGTDIMNGTAWLQNQTDNVAVLLQRTAVALTKQCEQYAVPDGVEVLSDGLFDGNTTLTGLDLPDSLKYIGKNCLRDCVNLKGIVFPAHLQQIPAAIRGSLVSDLIVYLGSIDFVMSDVDR